MLTEITKLLSVRGAMSLAELAQHFKVDVSAMEGMLDLLERKGRIEQEKSACFFCKGCAEKNPADLAVYRAADRSPEN